MGKEIKRTVFAAVIGILGILAMTGFFTWTMLREILDPIHTDLMATGTLITGSGAAALSCGRGEGSGKRITCAEAGMLLFLCLVNLILYDGVLFDGLLPSILLVAGTGTAVLLTQTGKFNQRNTQYRRRKHQIGKLNKKYTR